MTQPSIDRVKSLIASILAPQLTAAGVVTLTDELNLQHERVLDSLGYVELIIALEIQLGTHLDLSDLDAEDLTRVGALARHSARNGPAHAV